jgi:hypothetical protein
MKFVAKPDNRVIGTWNNRALIETGCGTVKVRAVFFPDDHTDSFSACLILEGSYHGRRYKRTGLLYEQRGREFTLTEVIKLAKTPLPPELIAGVGKAIHEWQETHPVEMDAVRREQKRFDAARRYEFMTMHGHGHALSFDGYAQDARKIAEYLKLQGQDPGVFEEVARVYEEFITKIQEMVNSRRPAALRPGNLRLAAAKRAA